MPYPFGQHQGHHHQVPKPGLHRPHKPSSTPPAPPSRAPPNPFVSSPLLWRLKPPAIVCIRGEISSADYAAQCAARSQRCTTYI
jgi:hypothetical protein